MARPGSPLPLTRPWRPSPISPTPLSRPRSPRPPPAPAVAAGRSKPGDECSQRGPWFRLPFKTRSKPCSSRRNHDPGRWGRARENPRPSPRALHPAPVSPPPSRREPRGEPRRETGAFKTRGRMFTTGATDPISRSKRRDRPQKDAPITRPLSAGPGRPRPAWARRTPRPAPGPCSKQGPGAGQMFRNCSKDRLPEPPYAGRLFKTKAVGAAPAARLFKRRPKRQNTGDQRTSGVPPPKRSFADT
jgi:hypothetical protein